MPMLVIALFLALAVAATEVSAQTKVEEGAVGASAPRTQAYGISKNGVHYAILTPKGAKYVVMIDGVEGPQFDELLGKRGGIGTVINDVIFTDDGSRHAYLARIGNEYILVVDGKEIYRSELLPTRTNLTYKELQFSPAGKHVIFMDLKPGPDRNGRARLIIDGKPGPESGNQAIEPMFSPDESRWAYNAVKVNGKIGGSSDQYFTVVDGKELPFNGFDPVFTADNKLLTNLKAGAPNSVIVPDGVSTGAKTGMPDGRWRITMGPAPVGSRWAGVRMSRKAGDPGVLFIDGKEVPEALDPEEVIFSPDGKRYMAICRNNTTRARFVVVDGKKGPDYQSIVQGLSRFTPDSSRAIYVGMALGKHHVVVDGQAPAEGYMQITGSNENRLVVSKKGGRFGYVAGDGSGVNQFLNVDGKLVPLNGRTIVPDSLSFSPDGSRYGYVASQRPAPGSFGPSMVLVVDGKDVSTGVTLGEFVVPNQAQVRQWWAEQWGMQAKHYVFSPDGKHVVYTGIRDKQTWMFVDGKALIVAQGNTTSFPSWTPDSKHIYWMAQEKTAERPQAFPRIFLNAKATTVRVVDFQQPTTFGHWQVGTDGSLRFIAFEGPVAKRYRIIPGADTNIDTVLAAAK